MTGEYRRIDLRLHNNHLFAQIVALKTNIAASQLGITTDGFYNLEYNMPGHPLHGKTVMQISAIVDTALSFWNGRGTAEYVMYDSVITKINEAFTGRLDTLSFAGPEFLKLRGGRKLLEDVPFLRMSPTGASFALEPLGSPFIEDELPMTPELYNNYPNPFNPSTTISFVLPEPSTVRLSVYNVLGQLVGTLIDGEEMAEGLQEVQFVADGLASGVYFYRIVSEPLNDDGSTGETFTAVKKMLLVK